MACEVENILSSQCARTGIWVHTLRLRYWRAIHAEFMTHRVFSRNAGSSRAIPVKKVLQQVWNDPAGPIHWGANQAGMQARAELVGWRRALAGGLWRLAGKVMCGFAWGMMKLGLHKQVANRLLEPWQYINVLVTSTEWRNFFKLRVHPDAQPEIQELATAIQDTIWWVHASPEEYRKLQPGEWHIPYTNAVERREHSLALNLALSTARCARISYEPFDGNASITKELGRHAALVSADPPHMSPAEHQLRCMGDEEFYANTRGFKQYRMFLEHGVAPR